MIRLVVSVNVALDEFCLLALMSRGLPDRDTVVGRPGHWPLEGHQWM